MDMLLIGAPVNIKRLNENAKIPTRGSADAAGYDLYYAGDKPLAVGPHWTAAAGTGVAMAIPQGYFGAIYARSGLAAKRYLRPGNCVGR